MGLSDLNVFGMCRFRIWNYRLY